MPINSEDVITGFLLTQKANERRRYDDQPLRFEQFTARLYAILSGDRLVAQFNYKVAVHLERIGFLDREERTTALPRWTIQLASHDNWADISETIYGPYDRNDDHQMAHALELIRGIFPDQQVRLVLSVEKKRGAPPITPQRVAELLHHVERARRMLADLRVRPEDQPKQAQLTRLLDFRQSEPFRSACALEGVGVARISLIHNERVRRLRSVRASRKRRRIEPRNS